MQQSKARFGRRGGVKKVKILRLTGILTGVVLSLPLHAQFGGVVVCTNCSEEGSTLAMKATQAMQYLKEAQTAMRAIEMAQMMTREGMALAKHPSTNIAADLGMLSTILVQSQGLAGTMAQMDTQFRQMYGIYNGPDAAVSFGIKYDQWATNTLKTISGALNAAGYQGNLLQNEQTWMSQIQSMNTTPLGRDESLQLGNTIAIEEVSQLEKLRQLMIADMQSKAAVTAQQVTTEQVEQRAAQDGFAHANWAADPRIW